MNNIILIGFMGCGKTSVGSRLAQRIHYDFKDTDELIEREEGRTINQIFEEHGETYFRDTEESLLKKLKYSLEGTVLSTGGGMPIREANQVMLRDLGHVIYLRTSVETTIERLRNDTKRPLLAGEDLEQKVSKLLTQRKPIYEACAHTIVDTDGLDFDCIIDKILNVRLNGVNI